MSNLHQKKQMQMEFVLAFFGWISVTEREREIDRERECVFCCLIKIYLNLKQFYPTRHH